MVVQSESGEFGPNSAQVERFLALLAQLDSDDWAGVEAAAAAAPASVVTAEPLLVHALGYAQRAGDLASDYAPRPGNADVLAQRAALALAVRDELGARFDDLYRPFAAVVPIECVEGADCGHEKHRGHVLLRGTHTSDGSE